MDDSPNLFALSALKDKRARLAGEVVALNARAKLSRGSFTTA
jgi:hypothetical protein